MSIILLTEFKTYLWVMWSCNHHANRWARVPNRKFWKGGHNSSKNTHPQTNTVHQIAMHTEASCAIDVSWSLARGIGNEFFYIVKIQHSLCNHHPEGLQREDSMKNSITLTYAFQSRLKSSEFEIQQIVWGFWNILPFLSTQFITWNLAFETCGIDQ